MKKLLESINKAIEATEKITALKHKLSSEIKQVKIERFDY